MTPVIWSVVAERDRDAQLDYVAAESARAAASLDERFERAVEQLREYPMSGRPGRIPGTRELVVVGTPYLLIYVASETTVEIARLLHGAQRWPPRRHG